MAGGQWEVVGGKSKKPKAKNDIPKAAKDKTRQDGLNIEAKAPICETQTIYSFLETEKKEPTKQKVSTDTTPKIKDKNAQSKKKKDKKTTLKPTIEDSCKQINEEEFKLLLARLEAVCPESRLVWLKDVVAFFNVKLDIPVEDSTFSGKPVDYPCSLLNKGVNSLILKTFKRCSPELLELFFDYSLQNMVSDSLKGLHTLGYRVVLQCLAQQMPYVVLKNLSKCTELCNTHQNRQNICLAVMWTAGQAGNKNLEAGFQIWTDFMFPLIKAKGCTTYVVEYLERLVSSENLSTIKKSIIDVKSLFKILDFIYSKDISKNVQKRLFLLFPTLKNLSYGPDLETSLRNYFSHYLRRLDANCSAPLRDEILNSLVYCLEKDVLCYSSWRQLYSQHFNQSKMLIAHLNDNWNTLSPSFLMKCLLETLSVFQVTNEELLNSNKKSHAVKECVLINKELLAKIHDQKFPWGRIVLLLVFLLSLALLCDIYTNNSFKDSTSGKWLEKVGLLAMCTQAGEKLSYYYAKMYKLLQMYLPNFFSWMQKNVIPHFEAFLQILSSSVIHVWDISLPVRLQLAAYVKSLMHLIDAHAPVYGNLILAILKEWFLFLSKHFKTVIDYVFQITESVVLWLQSSSLVMNLMESLQIYSLKFVTAVQEYLSAGLKLLI